MVRDLGLALPRPLRAFFHHFGVDDSLAIHLCFCKLFSNLWIIFANFKRPVLGCIDSNVASKKQTKYLFESSWRDLQDLLTCAPSAFKNTARCHQTCSHVCNFILNILFIVCNYGPKITNFVLIIFFGISEICTEKIKSPR